MKLNTILYLCLTFDKKLWSCRYIVFMFRPMRRINQELEMSECETLISQSNSVI